MRRTRVRPVRPVAYLQEVLDELGVSQYRLAQAIGVAPMRISHVVRGQRPVTAELALRLGRYFRQSPRFWLNLQSRYDMDVTEEALGKLVEREVQPLKAVAWRGGQKYHHSHQIDLRRHATQVLRNS